MLKYLKAKAGTLAGAVRRKGLAAFIDRDLWGRAAHQVNKNVLYRFTWRSFVKDVKAVKATGDVEKAVDFCYRGCRGLIAPLQVRSEITQLVELAREMRPKTVVEIGTCNGGSLFLLSVAAAPDAEIISIDLPYGEFGGGYPEWAGKLYESFATERQVVRLIREDSHKRETFERLRTMLGGRKVDFMFIDGDHSYEGVKRDFEMYSGLVRKGGVIALHDVAVHKDGKCDVSRFWDEIKGKFRTEEIIEDKNQGGFGIGVVFVE